MSGIVDARLAQSVEHRSYEPKVMGSSPIPSIMWPYSKSSQSLFRFDGHSNYYVLTAISPNKAFYLLYTNIALNAFLHKGKIMLYLTSNIHGNVQQISLSLFKTGCGFDPRCSTWKRGLVPMENCIVSRTILFDFVLFMLTCPSWSKGEHLRCSVFARVGSNPTVSIF